MEHSKICQAFWTGGKCDRAVSDSGGSLCSGHSAQYYRDVAFSPLRKYESKEAASWKEKYEVILEQRNKLIRENMEWQAMYEKAAKDYEEAHEQWGIWEGDCIRLANELDEVIDEINGHRIKNILMTLRNDPIEAIELVYGKWGREDD